MSTTTCNGLTPADGEYTVVSCAAPCALANQAALQTETDNYSKDEEFDPCEAACSSENIAPQAHCNPQGSTSTDARLAEVSASRVGGRVALAWTTANETSNVGFHVYGRTAQGETRRLTEEMVPSSVLSSFSPATYALTVPDDGMVEWFLEDIDSSGRQTRHGPFSTQQSYGVDSDHWFERISWESISRLANAEDSRRRARERALRAWREQRLSERAWGHLIAWNWIPRWQAEATLWVFQAGIARVSFESLLTAGFDFSGVPVSGLALTDAGEPQWRHVEDDDGVFGPGDYVEFLAVVEPTLYSRKNAYRLSVDSSNARPVRSFSSRGPLLWSLNDWPAEAITLHTNLHEPQRSYHAFAPGNDPWYDAWMLATPGSPAEITREFDLPGYAGGNAELRVNVWGVNDQKGSAPDHHLTLRLNGERLGGDVYFDARDTPDLRFTVPAEMLKERDNSLAFEVPGDTGFPADAQILDGFTVQYPRFTRALEGAWSGVLETARPVRVGELQGPAVAWRGEDTRFSFDGASAVLRPSRRGHVWSAADSRGLVSASAITPVTPPAEPVAVDYLIISHPLFLRHLDALEALQQARGWSTAVVNVESVYAAYSDNEPSADALTQFIRESSPRYVLLVGGDTHDYHDHMGVGSRSFIPTHYAQAHPLVTFAPTDMLHADGDGDGAPDVAIGRLPVRTHEELETLMVKLLAYAPPEHATLVTGNSDVGRRFAKISEQFEANLPEAWTAHTTYADDLELGEAKDDLFAELNAGGSLVSYVGHSSHTLWSSTQLQVLLSAEEARSLSNDKPLVVAQWGCWNTYFVDPELVTMADAFLFNPDGGAVAVLGATSLTDESALAALGDAFFTQMHDTSTLGDALLNAQRELALDGDHYAGALRSFVLLGDPATPLAPPSCAAPDTARGPAEPTAGPPRWSIHPAIRSSLNP